MKLDNLPLDHEERVHVEKRIIKEFYHKVFKHLKLVSHVLRFVDEKNHMIYSPPVAHILNLQRGYSCSTKYLSYIKEVRKYKKILD